MLSVSKIFLSTLSSDIPKFIAKLLVLAGLSLPFRVGVYIVSGILRSNKHNYKISNNIATNVNTSSGIHSGKRESSIKSVVKTRSNILDQSVHFYFFTKIFTFVI